MMQRNACGCGAALGQTENTSKLPVGWLLVGMGVVSIVALFVIDQKFFAKGW